MIETVSRPHARNFIEWSADKPKVVVLSADLTGSCEIGEWRDVYPDRFFSMGMAEQNMLGFAAGMAREGFQPWVHTFAVFLYRRPLDQLQMSVAYPNLPVRLVGFLPGITTPGGVTHQAIDDLAVMRVIPNMTVLETGDATEVETVLDIAHSMAGPVYIRMLRGSVPRLFPRDEPFVLSRARVLADSDVERVAAVGTADIAVLTSGIMTEEALRVMPAIRSAGVTVTHLHISTLKPFDDPLVWGAIESSQFGVVTMENHLVNGGMGSAVAELIAESGIGRRLVRLGLRDSYAHGASVRHLLDEYQMGGTALVAAVEDLLGHRLGISSDAIAAQRQGPVNSDAQAEAL